MPGSAHYHLHPGCFAAWGIRAYQGGQRLDLVRQGRRSLPRRHALLHPSRSSSSNSKIRLIQWPSVVLIEAFLIAPDVAHENIGLPHFQLESMLHGRPLAKFDAHRWPLVTHWNAYVANTQLHGKGTFYDPHERRAAVPARGEIGRLEQARRARSHYVEAGGAALLSALDSRAPASEKLVQRLGGGSRQNNLRGQGQVCDLPCPTALHGARLADAYGRGDRHRRVPGEPLARQEVARHRSRGCSRARRAGSITTAGSRTTTRSLRTTTACTSSACRPRRRRTGRVSEIALSPTRRATEPATSRDCGRLHLALVGQH
jgi:hypothetical protein